jgi:hypothetical protein
VSLVKELEASVSPVGTDPQGAVILEGVEAFRVRVLPGAGQQWVESWQSDADKIGSLPRAVALELVLADGTDTPPVYRLVVDLPLGARS